MNKDQAIAAIGVGFSIVGAFRPDTLPDWANNALLIVGLLIVAYGLLAIGRARRASRVRQKSSPEIGVGGRGGAAVVNGTGRAYGGPGGGGGVSGRGGAGGSATVNGSGTAIGGEGGEAGQADRGGRGGRSGYDWGAEAGLIQPNWFIEAIRKLHHLYNSQNGTSLAVDEIPKGWMKENFELMYPDLDYQITPSGCQITRRERPTA